MSDLSSILKANKTSKNVFIIVFNCDKDPNKNSFVTRDISASSSSCHIFLAKEFFDKDKAIVPVSHVLTMDEKENFLRGFKGSEDQLPKIYHDDPACVRIGAQVGDIIQFSCQSLFDEDEEDTLYWRRVCKRYL